MSGGEKFPNLNHVVLSALSSAWLVGLISVPVSTPTAGVLQNWPGPLLPQLGVSWSPSAGPAHGQPSLAWGMVLVGILPCWEEGQALVNIPAMHTKGTGFSAWQSLQHPSKRSLYPALLIFSSSYQRTEWENDWKSNDQVNLTTSYVLSTLTADFTAWMDQTDISIAQGNTLKHPKAKQ